MNLAELVEKIKYHYTRYLTGLDLSILDNNPTEDEVRDIVNKIWNQYLTDPLHHNDKDFRYLVEQSSIIDLGLVNLKDLLLEKETHFFKILSNENISFEKVGRVGFIIKADWLNSNKILLPDDLINGVFVRTKYLPTATFCINIGEGKISAEYDLADIVSQENNIPFVDLNLRKFKPNYELGIGDKHHIINGIVSYYLDVRNKLLNMEEHERLRKLYGLYIIKRYNKLIIDGTFNIDEFIEEMSNYIDTHENNHYVNSQKKSK
ncbi:MAG: hypothetical protein GX265_01210 [Mollicutes bacterium]|nr:hypothetical protein [Mollicutes bacterium]